MTIDYIPREFLDVVTRKIIEYIHNDTYGQYKIKRVEISPNGEYILIEVESEASGKSHFYLFDSTGEIIWSKSLLGNFYIFVGDRYVAGIDVDSKVTRIYRNTKTTVETYYVYPPDTKIYLTSLIKSEFEEGGVLILSTKDKKKVQGSTTSLPVYEIDISTLTAQMNFTGLKYYLNKVSKEFFEINGQYWGLLVFNILNKFTGPLNRYQISLAKFDPNSNAINIVDNFSINSSIKSLHGLELSEVSTNANWLWGVAYDRSLNELIILRIPFSESVPRIQKVEVPLRDMDINYLKLTTDKHLGLFIVYRDLITGKLNFTSLSYDLLEDILTQKIQYLSPKIFWSYESTENILITVSKNGKFISTWDSFSGTLGIYRVKVRPEKDSQVGNEKVSLIYNENNKMDMPNSDNTELNNITYGGVIDMIKSLLNKYGQVILYGPPGTGKTYLARKIGQFDKDSDVKFVTFHKSYSYEDFVEGYRPDTNKKGDVIYRVHDGIFKRLSIEAIYELLTEDTKKKILPSYQTAVEEHAAKKAWKKLIDNIRNEKILRPGLRVPEESSDYIEVRDPIKRIFREDIEKYRDDEYLGDIYEIFMRYKREEEYQAKKFIVQRFLESIHNKSTLDINKHLNVEGAKKFYLVIDEINRGDVSRIFGELITLLEQDKRLGADNPMIVTLPYSRELFAVPINLHIIGTMNSADRGIAILDVALRRRFAFIEVTVDYDELNNIVVRDINIADLLRAVNSIIDSLKGKDYRIGHSYFIELKDKYGPELVEALIMIWYYKVLPLLQDYFYHRWDELEPLRNFIDPKTGEIRWGLMDDPNAFLDELKRFIESQHK